MPGFADERREQIVSAMEAKLGRPRSAPVGDGQLHLSAQIDRVALAGATVMAVSNFSQILRDAGVTPAEMRGNASLVMAPADREAPDAPSGARANFARKLAASAHGMGIAAAEAFDLDVRQKHGDQTMVLFGWLTGLTPDASERLTVRATDLFASAPKITDGEMTMTITCSQVGGGLGAMLLGMRKLYPLLLEAPACARLVLHTEDAEQVARAKASA
jgi:hypothetical protein